jgi:HD-GYP domain-containing protein (c-di-GMP phosphodiesterase class II)
MSPSESSEARTPLETTMFRSLETETLPLLDDEGVRAQLLRFAEDFRRLYAKERSRAQDLERTLEELEESYFATVKMAAFIVEARDSHTRSHLDRAQEYAVALAQRVAPELADDKIFRYGFLLHDIGKVGIPDHILKKPSPLTREEWLVMQTHPILGEQMLGSIKFLERAVPIVGCHHERWDGDGYPRQLKGEDIPLGARVFSVVDSFDAMTSDRPYRRAMSVEQAVDEILEHAGRQHDPDIARAFADLCRERTEAWPLNPPTQSFHTIDPD